MTANNRQKNTAPVIGVTETVKEEMSGKLNNLLNSYHNIPDEMKKYNNWLVHKNKVPYAPLTGRMANGIKWCSSFEQAIKALSTGEYDGLGFHFDNTPFTGIDLDNHINNKEFDSFSMEVYLQADSYCEYSPSGSGLHIIVKGEAPYPVKNSKEGIEIYSQGRYFTVTGDKVPQSASTIAYRQEVIDALCAIYKADITQERVIEGEHLLNRTIDELNSIKLKHMNLISRMRSHDKSGKFVMLFDEGNTSLYKQDSSSADMALLSILAFWVKYDPQLMHDLFCLSALAKRDKWQMGNTKKDPMYYRKLSIYKAIAYVKRKDRETDKKVITATRRALFN